MMAASKGKARNKNDENILLCDLVESLALMPQILDKYETRFLRVEQSELYQPAGMVMPKLPMYHPYHPFKHVTKEDGILQVPLAMIIDGEGDGFRDLVPVPLREHINKKDIGETPIIQYFIAQTLPYNNGTEVICRYQYALFPHAKGEMKGHEAIWAQSIIYEKDKEIVQLPATQIKIYESDKNEVSPTILCGDSMKLEKVEALRGRGLWSLVLGSHTGALGDDGLFTDISHAFVGFTYFISETPGGESYLDFLRMIRNRSPREVLNLIPDLLEMDTGKKLTTMHEKDISNPGTATEGAK